MPRPRSILQRVEVDETKKAHNCQHNRRHRLEKGDKRLKVWANRTAEHYCSACALQIIERDIAKLQAIVAHLQEEQ